MKSFFNETLNFLFRKYIYFSTSFGFYFQVSYTYFQISAMISINIAIIDSFIKFDVAIATFKNLLNFAVLEEHLNKMDLEKVS